MTEEKRFLGMDTGSDPHIIGTNAGSFEGAYADALNIVLFDTDNARSGMPQSIKSMVHIDTPSALGRFRTIGTIEDKTTQTLYAFRWNSLGNHQVVRFASQRGAYGEVDLLVESPLLDFAENSLITGSVALNGQILKWTDNNVKPRSLSITRALNYQKKNIIELYFPQAVGSPDSRAFSVTILNAGIPVLGPLSFYTALTADIVDYNAMIRGWASAFNASLASQFFTAESCGEYITLTAVNDGEFSIDASYIETVATVPQPSFTQRWIYTNRYNDTWTEIQFTDSKIQPPSYPIITSGIDPTRKVNYLERNYFQFAIGYRFPENEKSTLGPHSRIPFDSNACGETLNSNYLDIDFDNSYFSADNTFAEINKVVIYVSINGGNWKEVVVLDHHAFAYSRSFRFYNDLSYPDVDLTFSTLHDSSNPHLSKSMAAIADTDSNTRIVQGGLTEGYENPCIDANLGIGYDGSNIGGGGCTISGRVKILNSFMDFPYSDNGSLHNLDGYSGSDDNIVYGGIGQTFIVPDVGTSFKQYAPMGGFLVYLAGTRYYDYTKQVKPTATLLSGCGVSPTMIGDTGVFDSSQPGGAINNCNDTFRAAIRWNMTLLNPDGIYSEFEIQNVPPGTYILRFADPAVSPGDMLGLGSLFDLNNGLEWQKTSCPVGGINGIMGATELVITVSPGQTSIVLQDSYIMDLTNPTLTSASYGIKGYAYDNNGNSDPVTLVQSGFPMERQLVVIKQFSLVGLIDLILPWNPFIPPFLQPASALFSASELQDVYQFGNCKCDHNGFFWFANDGLPISVGRTAKAMLFGCTGNPAIPHGDYTVVAGQIVVNNLTIIKSLPDQFYRGVLGGTLTPDTGNIGTGSQLYQVVFYNPDPVNSEKLSTKITGAFLNPSGQPISGMVAYFTGSGNVVTSGPDGVFTMRVWSDMWPSAPTGDWNLNHDDRDGTLYFYNDTPCQVDFAPANIHIYIPQFEANQDYSLSHPWDVGNITATVNSITSIIGAFSHGYEGNIGIVYIDEYGQATPPVTIDKLNLRIPFMTDTGGNEGIPLVTVTINNGVPIPQYGRFTHYMLVRTQDTESYRLDIPVDEVKYVIRYDNATTSRVETTFAAGNAKEIYMDVGAVLNLYQEQNSDSQLGYVWEENDRVILIKNSDGVTFTQYFDVVIKKQVPGQTGDPEGSMWIVIDNLASFPELGAGTFIRIYRKNRNATIVPYQEIPGTCYTITDPYGANPTHSNTSIAIGSGNAYYYKRPIQLTSGVNYVYRVESKSISDFWTSQVENLGRLVLEDPDAAQIQYPSAMRISNGYLPNTPSNGASMYEPLNRKLVNVDFGLLEKLVYAGQVLIVIGHNSRTTAFYVNRGIISDAIGGQLVVLTDKILGTDREFFREWGTQNSESIVVREGYIWGFDNNRQVIWGYSVNGLDSKTDYGLNTFIQDVSSILRKAAISHCPAGFDPKYDLIYFSFSGQTGAERILNAVTLSFHEKTNKWQSFMSFKPECYGTVGPFVTSFLAGDMWVHNLGDDYGKFYGVQYPSSITPVFNSEPSSEKFWLALELKTNGEITSPSITNDKNQSSDLTDPQDWLVTEGARKASILRDTTTPVFNPIINGRVMRSETLTVKLEWNSPDYVYLFSITGFYELSERTNK